MDVIYPANDKHILKFTTQPMYLVQETEEMYQTITLPHILDHSFSLQVCCVFLKIIPYGKYEICWIKTVLIYIDDSIGFYLFSGYTTVWSINPKKKESNTTLPLKTMKMMKLVGFYFCQI